MKVLLSALVSTVLLFFIEIEASGLKKINTKKMAPTNDDEDPITANYVTSRRRYPTDQDKVWLRNHARQSNQGPTRQSSNPDVPDSSNLLNTRTRQGIRIREGQEISTAACKEKIKNKKEELNESADYDRSPLEKQESYEKVNQRLSKPEHSSTRPIVDNKESIPEELRKDFEAIQVYHKYYAIDDEDDSYRKCLENYFSGSNPGSGK